MDLTGNIKNPGIIFAEMQGTIMDTMTKQGKKVKKGDSLFVLEAMKKGLQNCDIVMMLRIQKERIVGKIMPNQKTYFKKYGLDYNKG